MVGECSTGGATSSKREAVEAMAEVGGVRSSDDLAPNLWFGQPAGERRDATCSVARKRNEELVTARKGYKRQEGSGVANPRRRRGFWPRCKEPGKPDAGKPPVRFDEGREVRRSLALGPFNPSLPAYSTQEASRSACGRGQLLTGRCLNAAIWEHWCPK